MKNLVLHKQTTILLIMLFVLYVSTTIVNISILSTLLKYIILLVVITIFILQSKHKSTAKKTDLMFLPALIFCGIYLLKSSDLDGFMIVINQISLILYAFVLYRFLWKKEHLKIFSKLFYGSLPFIFLGILFKGTLVNENTLASIILYTSFFPILYIYGYKKIDKSTKVIPVVLLSLVLILLSGARSTFLAGFAGIVTFVFWKKLRKRKLLSSLYFFAVCFGIYLVTVIYPTIDSYSFYPKLNYWSLTLFNKPIFTGRNTIWKSILSFIDLNPYFGHGASATPGDFYQTTLSSHNLYLQTALQVGLIGIFFLGLLFFTIWKNSVKVDYDPRIRITSSYLIIIMVHQIFEVTLTQNQFLPALLQWTIIGISCSFISQIYDTKNQSC